MTTDDILQVIVSNTIEVIPRLGDHQFQPNDALKDLGANSIDRSEIVMMTLETLSLNVPLVELASAGNIGQLAQLLHEKQ